MTLNKKLQNCNKIISPIFSSYEDMKAYQSKICDKMLWDNKTDIVKMEIIPQAEPDHYKIITYYIYYVLGKAKNKSEDWRI